MKILGGVKEGMVHVSQMHTSRIGHPEDMVKLGDIVHVKSLNGQRQAGAHHERRARQSEPDPNAPKRERPSNRNDRGGYRDRRSRGRNDRFNKRYGLTL